jgi:hypothetical protein
VPRAFSGCCVKPRSWLTARLRLPPPHPHRPGNNLLNHLRAKKVYSEKDVSEIARALVSSVAYCHHNGGHVPAAPARCTCSLRDCLAPVEGAASRRGGLEGRHSCQQ